MILHDSAILNNLYVPGITRHDSIFEKRYINCRSRERRIYTDEEVKALPECNTSNPHYHEWQVRNASSKKLYTYLQNKKKPLHILEIGCGNGWLLHRLSGISRSKLVGVDINFTELQQAARIFISCPKMKFIYGDIFSGILNDTQFDAIIFAASIQYFESLDGVLDLCLHHLKPDGEIHVMDTQFYQQKDVPAAKKRSDDYYASMNFPEMARHYFHHSLSGFAQFNYTLLHDPHSLYNRLTRNPVPFHWIKVNKDAC